MRTIFASETVSYEFTVCDDDGNRITGLLDTAFGKVVFKNGAGTGISATVTEISNGVYNVSFSHTGVGRYMIQIDCSTSGISNIWEEHIDVIIGGEQFLGRAPVIAGNNAEFEFEIVDRFGDLVTGVSSFGIELLSLNGVNVGSPGFAIAEIGTSGRYKCTFPAASAGVYEAVIGDQLRGMWKAIFDCATAGPPTAVEIRNEMDANSTKLTEVNADTDELLTAVAAIGIPPAADVIAGAILDAPAAIDGKTPREALQYIAATTCMESSGDPSGPVTFLGLDGSTKRVKSTMDGDGNRISVTLDPP